ncbi:MAG: hypothetical protein ABJE63_09815 [Lentilitoribacter sp.]
MRLPTKIITIITGCSVFAAGVSAYAAIYMTSNGAENVGLWVTGVTALALLAVLNFAILAARVSTRRVQIMQLQLQELIKGNTNFVVYRDKQQDEFSNLAHSIEALRIRIAEQNRLPSDTDDELKALNIKTASETDVSMTSPDVQANSLKNTAEIMRFAALPAYSKDGNDWDDV